jgi:ABC-2 type transport system ATP-binding protein
MSTPPCITLTEVTKVFKTGLLKSKKAVDNLNLEIPAGEVVGLLGPNGSGKSTTLKMILGFLKPTSGEILICGQPAEQRLARSFIGYLPENPRFQKFLTGNEILRYYGKLLGLSGTALSKRTESLLDLVNLKHAGDERVQGYSKGMTQRLAIAQSLLNTPPLLIFDEPMSGLDPIGRIEMRTLINTIHTENPKSTLFFSSHVLEDVENLCKSVALLQKGKLKTYASIESLISNEQQSYDIILKNLTPDAESQIFKQCPSKILTAGKSFSIKGPEKLTWVLSQLMGSNAKIVSITGQRRQLEEALFRANDGLSTGEVRA